MSVRPRSTYETPAEPREISFDITFGPMLTVLRIPIMARLVGSVWDNRTRG